MRVIECNHCGETISAASNDELTGRLATHLGDEHDESPDVEELQEVVESQAYEAADS